ncbi:hypothetical protein LWI28_012092 [Acer negundo]|uniref:Retrotransposon gag domain-containing protein n=1 Tax=Acer negundo TaxID=4023 RepID=A0AAD5P444_ACENE|nr:hypothetical protein LWI28_012092 [Acer negundo]
MAKELEELKKVKHQEIRRNPLGEMNVPFSKRIRDAGLPPKFRMPSKKYSRTEDPISHLERFVHRMEVQNATGLAMCRMFPSTLTDYSQTWFRKLPLETYQEAYNRALEQVDIEKHLRIKVEHDEARLAPRPKKEAPKPVPVKRFQNQPPNRSTYRPPSIPSYQERCPTRRSPLRRSPPRAAPLRSCPGGKEGRCPMKVPTDMRNQYKYCYFHEDVGRNTSECYSLRNQIEGLWRPHPGWNFNSRKNHVRKIPRLNAGHEIFKVSSGSRDPSRSTKIVFVEENVYNTVQPHDDLMLHFAFVWFHRGLCNAYGIKNPAGDSRRSSTSAERDDRVHRGGLGIKGGHLADQLEEIPIKGKDLTKVVKVRGGLDPKVMEDLIKLLREYSDIFAWTYEEMHDIPLSLATHKLAIDSTVKPVKQKRRHFNAERNAAV